ncbi:histone-like nucleoid-structuring protein Lsr2 [Microbispora sp. NBC_01389]|uniref:Lsr2 family DNA-binding protein n=1 Tax=Microbispora sp. NBC_01389 TaxID=2903584 RepID=UPI00386D5F1C
MGRRRAQEPARPGRQPAQLAAEIPAHRVGRAAARRRGGRGPLFTDTSEADSTSYEPAARKGSEAGGPTTADVRRWARDNGFDVSDRGRLRPEIRLALMGTGRARRRGLEQVEVVE